MRALSIASWPVVLVVLMGVAAAAQTPTDFSGTWVLDKLQSTGVPEKLESYTLNITQDADRITLVSKIEGDIEQAEGQDGGKGRSGSGGQGGQGGGMGGSRTSTGGMGGVGSILGGVLGGGRKGGTGGAGGGRTDGGGTAGAGPRDMTAVIALRMWAQPLTYTLDGRENAVTLEPREGEGDGPAAQGGIVTLSTKWLESKKRLELRSTRSASFKGKARRLTSTDRLELADDGSLRISRKVETQKVTQEVRLTFTRQ